MLNPHEITGIILAGGKSSRMGKDKGTCSFKNKPLVEYAIEALKPFCGELLLSANNIESYNKYTIEVVPDEISSIGPLGGMFTCLKKSKTRHNIILSCDTPFITMDLIKYIIENIDSKNKIIAPLHRQNFIEPLCAYYSKDLIPVFEEFIENKNYKLLKILNSVELKTLRIDSSLGFYSPKLFNNLNTPEDLLKC
jgi:molybdopterin-guanine dinucleotide biosynthesis protein A